MSGGGRSSSPPGNNVDNGFSMGTSETSGLGVGAGGQMTAAERMMAKMGWKQGQGLGKSEQGITTPLMAKKTDRRAGVIVNASEKKVVKGVSISGEPTRVLLLRNMVCALDCGACFCIRGHALQWFRTVLLLRNMVVRLENIRLILDYVCYVRIELVIVLGHSLLQLI